MASYTTTAANLLEFAQSRLMTGIDAKRPDRVFVCIPVDVNEIKTSTDNNGKARADARLALWPMRNREAYLTRINAKRMAAGDQPKTLDQMPTHTLQVAHSEEFIMANIKIAATRQTPKKTLQQIQRGTAPQSRPPTTTS